MAALFEGEGYVAKPQSRQDRQGRHSSPLRIRFTMCDRDVLERFQSYSNGGNLSGPHKPTGLGKKDTYKLTIQGYRAYELLSKFWAWLGTRRRSQITTAITKWGSMKPTCEGRSITRDDVTKIKEQLINGKHGINRLLARQYGISEQMISRIKTGRAWT